MGIHFSFITIFAIIGLLISAICGWIVGNRVGHIIFVSSLGTLAFSALGLGIYKVIEAQVPEFLDFLGGLKGSSSGEDFDSGIVEGSDSMPGFDSTIPGTDELIDKPEMPTVPARKRNEKFGDHLIVDNIEIKNEPKLMAEAIRTMLAKDEESQ